MKCVQLILSGGASSRMGQPKALLPWGEKSWLEHQLESFRQADLGQSIVVLYQELSTRIPDSLMAEIVIQSNADRPMADSIRLGLNSHRDADLVFLLPIDTPAPPAETWQHLAMEARSLRDTWVIVPAGGGHPVALLQPAIRELIANEDWRLDHKLREWSEHGHVLQSSASFPHSHLNLNRPEEWATWLEQEGVAH